MDKELKKQIGKLAAMLPVSYYSANQKVHMRGSECIKRGLTEHSGKPVEPTQKYWVVVEAYYPVNHHRQMMKAFKLNGNKGLGAYIDGQREIHGLKHPIKLN